MRAVFLLLASTLLLSCGHPGPQPSSRGAAPLQAAAKKKADDPAVVAGIKRNVEGAFPTYPNTVSVLVVPISEKPPRYFFQGSAYTPELERISLAGIYNAETRRNEWFAHWPAGAIAPALPPELPPDLLKP